MLLKAALSAFAMVADGLRPEAGGAAASTRRRRQDDWAAPIAVANAHFVTPALYASLRDAGALADLPGEVRDYLAVVYQANHLRNESLREQASELAAALRAAGIRPMLLKGSLSLFTDAYPDAGIRMIRDLDVLVPAAAGRTAVGVLHALGYSTATRYPEGHHAYGDFVRPGDAGAVDLHFEPLDAAHLLAASEVWDRADPIAAGRTEVQAPSPTDWLMHTLLHAQIHHLGNFYRGVIELRQLLEFAQLTRRYGDRIDWAFIERRLECYRLTVPLHAYALAAERLLGLRWPLSGRPASGAGLQYRRCMAQISWPFLGRLAIPIGNIRSSFAWHRMRALYGSDLRTLHPILRHIAQYLRKSDSSAAFNRLFRTR